MVDVSKHLQPRSSVWRPHGRIVDEDAYLSAGRYLHPTWRLQVLSSLDNAEYPDGIGKGPQWHVSISRLSTGLLLSAWSRRSREVLPRLEPGLKGASDGYPKPPNLPHPTDDQCRRVLLAFGLEEAPVTRDGLLPAEQDNHAPGIAMHFWCPVDPAHRVVCQCKATEDVYVGADGYTWTNPKEGDGDCRGCIYADRYRLRCPIHGIPVVRIPF